MHGIKVAAGIIGVVIVLLLVVGLLVVGSLALFGPFWGCVVSIGVVLLVMFVVIAVVENR